MVIRLILPRRSPTRSWNQRLRALAGWCRNHSHASWIMVLRKRALPDFEMPCSSVRRSLCIGSMVRPPTPTEEDERRLTREREILVTERTRHVNRTKSLLATQGVFGFEPMHKD